jgi:Zn-dependent protease with chaperone function
MNFFERQEVARRSTRRLLVLFALAVLAIVAAVSAVVTVAIGFSAPEQVEAAGGVASYVGNRLELVALAALATLAVIGIASMVRIASLREGGAAVARQLGGVPVGDETSDPQLRRLRNVVEEIAIASCVPVPAIYVLENEAGINAFAAGYSPNDAAVAVTRGALDKLNRAELQGVIAHEFSHVLNGDMRLNIRLMGVLFGILVLGIAGRKVLMHTRGGRDSKGVAGILAVALALVVIGYVGVFFGRLIKAGVSRQREYLADASAVQFTRQTEGLAGALKKIAGVAEGSRLVAADTEEVSHMLFGDGVGYSALMATHPSLLERIRALEPQFDARALAEVKARYRASPPSGAAEDIALGFASEQTAQALPRAAAETRVTPQQVISQVAQPAADDYRRAGRLHDAIPHLLNTAAHSHDGATALVLALLFDADIDLRQRQLAAVMQALGAETAGRAEALAAAAEALHPALRLPLAALAFPALRRRPRAELERFIACTETLIHIDARIGLFEYCLARLLRRQVIEALDPSRFPPSGKRKLAEASDAVRDLFSVLAQHGHAAAGQAQQAFAAGVGHVLPQAALGYQPPGDWVAALDHALPQLDGLLPVGKQLLVEGLVLTSGHDGRLNVAEAELLRTVCACLHCPLPPVLDR